MHTFLKLLSSRSPFIDIDKNLHSFYKIDSGDTRLDVLSDTALLKY